ncbi:ribosome hibernation-promoting factor, HPF/YfiA family [Aeromicrobium fastidiosum]|uniref:Ribosome hibernation promoting factor n=1 Tax=Aeromicrobium fastidiosum TaxID=52699 RepID=A0A641APE4_9ACTN|nr:ribosome-associated translation inhibitor RaiA [Aeromicrobium fastidiosum]KAA1378267.1 ribosome-associated translation inhibitor RaiA [Aeromicrobium fastidiosum]MBP2388915.1 ribosomal subunit interface protein [Aeromicrobium fastidiosum]
MEIVVNGRNSEISERFREHVEEKLLRLEKYDARQKITRVEVEVTHEKNPRQHDKAAKVEMTLRSRGPAVRAEAASTDQHSALDAAIDKLESRLRRAGDRRRIHHGDKTPTSVAEATASLPVVDQVDDDTDEIPWTKAGPIDVQGESPLVVREKTHQGSPMTLEQAMYEMELVGHDFFLFLEKDSMRPSVVYLRKGYDYGVIHLDVVE